MALTQTHLNTLVEAWAAGTTSVTIDGKRVDYRSMRDLETAIAVTAKAIGAANPLHPARPVSRTSVTKFSRG
ncbi:phage head-tail joining protein [Azospirillum lipoferum]|uniref:Uncharacterized protein n=1 Tax=Azospirillum lipoferum (strain 4B) TaxID=862719 RepID=G7Z7R9_AZOL4|nr:hypothetical protein [Azospirillum lipoferum]CBS87038.1 conserved protein of unknown function [Azospirillum lipoferum 4B]